jgi:hypothetical protein
VFSFWGLTPYTLNSEEIYAVGSKDGPFASPVQDVTRNTTNVVGYIDRIRRDYFSEVT